MAKRQIYLLTLLIALSISVFPFAVSAQQGISAEEKARQMLEKEKELRKQIETKPQAPEIEKELPAPPPEAPESQVKTLITQINVTGATFLPEEAIQDIILQFQGKELTLREMQQAAAMITDAYRQKGYITSRAYLPPQKIEGGILEIRVVEGLMGELNVSGNRFFKARLFKRKIAIRKGEPFDYNKLRANLSKINQYPDRSVKAVLLPGKEAGTTDVNLEVKDNLPIHIGFVWDNYGSRFIGKDRYQAILQHNNLLGFDDSLQIQYQTAEANAYRLFSARYVLPVTATTDITFFAAKTKLDLGREFEDVNARGKSRLYSIYVTQDVISKENVGLEARLGFDYKDVFNFSGGEETSRDRMRVAKASANLDVSDRFGRTILDYEWDFGIPNIMGGLDSTDPRASRSGSGGKFVKNVITLLRLNKMPYSSTLLWKNQYQISPYILTATEQFQLGGIANLRGYPPAELVGDNGYTMTFEWSVPPYFVPKDMKVPFSKAKLYDALRFVAFYDWGHVRLRRPQAGEEKTETLSDIGCGFRFNLPENFSVRFDIAWPLNTQTPSDRNHAHPWIQISKEF